MSTNEPGAQNPYDPPSGGHEPRQRPGEPAGQPPEQPGGATYQPGDPTPSPGTPQPGQRPTYSDGGVPPSAYPAPAPGMQYPGQQYPKNSLGVWSLVLGILSWFVCPVIASIAAIITGHMSRRATREGLADNGGLGLAGIILGWASLILSVVAVIIFVVAFGAALNDPAFRDFLDDPSAWPTIDS